MSMEESLPDDPDPDPPDDTYMSGSTIPPHLRAPVAVARSVWHHCWPGMSLDGSAELVVMALDQLGYLKQRGTRRLSPR